MWLKSELERRGFVVWLPELPGAAKPSLQRWSKYVHEQSPFTINEDTLIIGHSSGAILALVLSQQNATSIGGVVGVSVFHDNSLNWDPNSELFDVDFDWRAIQTHAKKLVLVHSDNDPYVPLDQAEYVAKQCGVQLRVIAGQGHFNLETSPSYRSFPALLEILRKEQLIR